MSLHFTILSAALISLTTCHIRFSTISCSETHLKHTQYSPVKESACCAQFVIQLTAQKESSRYHNWAFDEGEIQWLTTPKGTVKETSAFAGDVLIGISEHNRDLRIAITERQQRGLGGRIKGAFVVLNGGTGKYSNGINAVISKKQEFKSAAEFIEYVSQQKNCQNVPIC
jgi:hypothetical protein